MKPSATLVNANILAHPHKEISPSDKNDATGSTWWRALTTRFWSYTEETGQTETKSFKGIL